jgi:putative tricarboxylic transport membrane protein
VPARQFAETYSYGDSKLIEAVFSSLGTILDPNVIAIIALGSIIGMVFGVLPGLSGIQGLALMLPFTYGWEPVTAMFFFAGIMGSVSEGGSIPAILINTPGSAINAATSFDGYPMARRGEAGRALGLAAASSSLGALFGILVLVLLIPAVRPIVLAFGNPEFFWLVLFGLATIAVVSRGNFIKGLISGGLGIMLSTVGFSALFTELRFTAGSTYLWDGIELVPFYIGLFALSELIIYTVQGGTIAPIGERLGSLGLKQTYQGAKEVFRYPLTFLRGASIGTLIGIIPGVGGVVATFISYTTAVQTSKHPELFGTGHAEGIIAAESANDAKDGGSLLPTVAFGIPGSAEMAVLLGAFMLHGLVPGPLLLRDHMDVVMALILGLVISNVLAGLFLFFAARYLARITFVPIYFITPVVATLVFVGAFALRGNIWDVFLALFAGIFGYFLKRSGFPIVSVAIGYILGFIAEKAFHQSLMSSLGSYAILFTRPICIILIALLILAITFPFFKARKAS